MYDVIVAGGGPAGSSAARRAAFRGLKVLLIEKERFPRFKACAGAVSHRALTYLDFAIPDSLREKEIVGLRLCYGGKTLETKNDSPIAVTVTRSFFDEYLLEKAAEAGASIRTGEKVREVKEEKDCVIVRSTTQSFRSRFAVICEGAHGILGKRLGLNVPRRKAALSVTAGVKAPDSVVDDRLPGLLEVHIGLFKKGYCWIFPHEGYFSVGLWGFEPWLTNLKGTMKRFLQENGFPEDIPFRGHLIPAGETVFFPPASRIIAAGDAGGFVDPLTGEGISFAIRSGQIAADSVADDCTKARGPAAARFEEACRREFADKFQYARMMAEVTYRFPSFFYDLLAGDPDLYRMLLLAPAMKRLYVDYLLWVFPRLHRSLLLYLKDRLLRSRL